MFYPQNLTVTDDVIPGANPNIKNNIFTKIRHINSSECVFKKQDLEVCFFFPVKILHMALKEINILVIYNFLYIYYKIIDFLTIYFFCFK